MAVGERIRDRIEAHPFLAGRRFSVRLTASVGIATLPDVATSAEELVRAADTAMYQVKELGQERRACLATAGRGCSSPFCTWDLVRCLCRFSSQRPRHRPRDGQHLRLRARQGHRRQRAVDRRHQQGQRPGRGGRPRGQGDAGPHARQHRRHPADEGRRHRRLRGHREDADATSSRRRTTATSGSARASSSACRRRSRRSRSARSRTAPSAPRRARCTWSRRRWRPRSARACRSPSPPAT